MEAHELMMTALRGLGVYALMLVVVRLMGKRAIGNFSAFDLLVALMLGEVVDEIIYGDVSVAQGAVAIIVVALAQYGTSWLSYWDHGFDAILEGRPSVIIKDGSFSRSGMRRERMSEHDVMSQLRMQGIADMREVKLAIVEPDGQVSIIKHEWAEPLQKADLGGEMAKQKEKDAGDNQQPPKTSTTSRWALEKE